MEIRLQITLCGGYMSPGYLVHIIVSISQRVLIGYEEERSTGADFQTSPAVHVSLWPPFFFFVCFCPFSASDLLGVVADGQTALWVWPGPEPWRNGELTDISRIKHADQVLAAPAGPSLHATTACCNLTTPVLVCLQPDGEAWWWWWSREAAADRLPSPTRGGAWALGGLHASRGGLAFPLRLTELCQRGIRNVIFRFNCLVCACLNLFTPPFFFLALQQDDLSNTLSQQRSPVPSLDRLAPERVSKRSSHSLDLNANENGVSEQSGSESLEDGRRGHNLGTGGCSSSCVCWF